MLKKSIAAARKDNARTRNIGITPEQEAEFREAFDLFDADGSGCIDMTEMRVAMRALGFQYSIEEVRTMLEGVDDPDDKSDLIIHYNEFLSFMTTKAETREPKEVIKEVFDLLDVNKKGKISLDDMKRASTSLNLNSTLGEETLVRMLELADVNGDGVVDINDFIKTMRKSPAF